MSKKSRKKRRHNYRERKHDFVSTLKSTPTKSKYHVIQTQKKSAKPQTETGIPIPWQKANILTTLTLAGIIIIGFIIIVIADNQTHFLTHLGDQLLNSINITL